MFEQRICEFTGAPYCVTVDNCSNAIFLALYYEKMMGRCDETIYIPKHTYPSVPCEIVHAGLKVGFDPSPEILSGQYQLRGSNVIDSSLHFSGGMYWDGKLQCLSFSGAYKHLSLEKGGAILTDDEKAYKWLKRARFSGRNEVSYHNDRLDMMGWNFYMIPSLAARGLLLMNRCFDADGLPLHFKSKAIKYPDLSKQPIWQTK